MNLMRGRSQLATLLSVGMVSSWVMLVPFCLAAPQRPAENQRVEMLAQMKALAATTEITLKGRSDKPVLLPNPVFRYDDQPRRFIDATLWVWTIEGRPVAFEKIEAMITGNTNQPTWGYCFASVSQELITAKWPGSPRFDSKEAAVPFRVITESPEVAERDTGKKRQARELARAFSVRVLIDPIANTTAEMRLLTTPIHEYSDPKTGQFVGAVYGYSSNGTNPDLLIMLEPQRHGDKLEWYFAPVRMTSGGLTLKYRDREIWNQPYAHGTQAPLPTWTFFQSPRRPLENR